jgi:uncharacterized SAM-binding protein YcdF (DUF218 family)
MVRGLAIVLVFGAGMYLGAPYLLAGAGRYLVTQDTLVRADLAVVLPGDLFLSVPEAARIYHEGLVPKILLINESRPRGQADLLRAGIRYPDALEVSLQLLAALRVPRQAILTIPDRAESLQAEADMVSRVVAGRSARTLIVITSKAHSRRARQVFVTRLGSKVGLVMHPVPGDPFDADRWWKQRMDAKQTVWEYAALLDWWRGTLWRKLVGAGETAPPPVEVR